ncbi:Na+/H+ antiporter subunit E [bacterium]|nr:Na+/H+ antiporter subunit E [bacterium]
MKRFTLFFISYIIWILLVLPLDLQTLILGFFVALIVALLFGKEFVENYKRLWHIDRLFWFLVYIPVFTYYLILANLDVMYRVLHPDLPINPGIVKVKTKLKSRSGRSVLCNSITLTPGTLSVDIEGEYIYIHWLNVKSDDVDLASKGIVEKFEKYLMKVFG